PAARGPAGGCRAAARGGARSQARGARGGGRLVRLDLPPGVDPARRAGLPAGGLVRRRRARPHGALLPGAARRRAGGPPARAPARVPDLQRLHDGAAQRARLGLLSARPVLSRAARARRARGREARRARGRPVSTPGAGVDLAAAWARLRPGRTVHGIAAVLLPYDPGGAIDEAAFERHVARTAAAGLDVAVNMDTGFGDLLTPTEREAVLDATRRALGPGRRFFAGA